MSRYSCAECGDTERPSNYDYNICQRCENSEASFQLEWAQKPLTPNPPDVPVWTYGG